MNQGKLEVVKQEMARVNVDNLGISKLKWTGMGEFNSADHYIYYCGQEPLRRNGVAIMVNKRVWNAVLGCNLKNDRMISVCFQGTIQYHGNQSLCNDQKCWRSWSWMILWRPTRPFRTNTTKRCFFFFHIRDWNAKVGSQETPGVTSKFDLRVQNEAGQRLIEFSQENSLVIANTLFQQHKRRLYIWTSPDGQHQK